MCCCAQHCRTRNLPYRPGFHAILCVRLSWPRSARRSRAILLLLGSCATGGWDNHLYGPGDWLNDNTALPVDTLYKYTHLVEPEITYHYIASGLSEYCGSHYVAGCAQPNGATCDIGGDFCKPLSHCPRGAPLPWMEPRPTGP